MFRVSISIAAATLLVLLAPEAFAQSARLTLQSQPGDYIGQGQTYDFTYTPANTDPVGGGSFLAYIVPTLTVSPQPAYLQFIFATPGGSPNRYTTLAFGTNQLGVPISTGTFLNAERAPFASLGRPGLDVSFQNRGSNTLTGNFTVTDVAFRSTASGLIIDRFSTSFEQHSEGATPALFGTFTYLSTAPEPGTLALLTLTALAPAMIVCRRR